jgi:hypothetical protein
LTFISGNEFQTFCEAGEGIMSAADRGTIKALAEKIRAGVNKITEKVKSAIDSRDGIFLDDLYILLSMAWDHIFDMEMAE